MSLLAELRRRNVLRVGAAYVVAAWLVIQVVETLFPVFSLPDVAIRIVVIVLAIGLVPMLVFAWVFELTPEGLKKEKDIDRAQSITPQTGKRLDRAIMVVLALAVGYFAFDKFVLDPARDRASVESAREAGRSEALAGSFGERSIAVLPFADMSPDGDQEYFADGISEELLNLLAKIPELRVAGRTSTFSYKGKDVQIARIGEELKVAHVLEGSVRKAGDQVRITAQLIEARSDTHLWSETYDRTLDNIFAIQDEIAGVVVEQLKIELLGEVPQTTQTDPEAYALYLQARYLRRQTSPESLEAARLLLESVLEKDPDYLPALDDLITVYVNLAYSGQRGFQEGFEKARELTESGLQIDPGYGRLYAQRGWIRMFYDNELQAGASDFERGLELEPTDAGLIGDTSTLLLALGRVEQSVELNANVLTLDPAHPVAWFNYGNTLAAAGRWDEAIAAFRRAFSLSPAFGGGRLALGLALLDSGDPEAALAEVEMESVDGFRWMGLAIVHHVLGNRKASDEAFQSLADAGVGDWGLAIAEVLARRGELDGAFRWIGQAIKLGDPGLAQIHTNQGFRNLWGDQRWTEFLEQLGKSEAQLDAIEFNPRLPD